MIQRTLLPAIVAALAIPALAALAAPEFDRGDKPMVAPLNDPEIMKAAFEARRTLPTFWRLLADNPQHPEAFAVKVAFPGERGIVDYLWLVNIKHHGNKVIGVLDNGPDARPDLHLGQTVTANVSDVEDWSIAVNGRQFGHYTTRVLIKRDPKAAAQLRSILSDRPMPTAADFNSH